LTGERKKKGRDNRFDRCKAGPYQTAAKGEGGEPWGPNRRQYCSQPLVRNWRREITTKRINPLKEGPRGRVVGKKSCIIKEALIEWGSQVGKGHKGGHKDKRKF